MISKTLITGLMCAVLASCGGDDDGDGGSKRSPYGDRRIDTKGFQNNASEGEFKAKGEEVDGYFEDLSNVKTAFLASGAGNSLIKGMLQVNDGGLAELGDCDQVVSTESTVWGELNVVTTTCKRVVDGATETCVTIEKTTLDGQLVSESTQCESNTGSQSGSDTEIEIGSNNQYVPSFEDVQDCDDAFASFEESYAGLKEEFDNMYGMLVQPDGLNLAGANLNGVGELKKVENDDKSAVTYEFVSPASSGVEMSGTVSGGANESTMLLRQDVKVKMDFSQMMPNPGEGFPEDGSAEESPWNTDPGMPSDPNMGSGFQMAMDSKGTIAVDMGQKLIEQDVDMSMTMGDAENGMTTTAKGRIALSAGEEKYVIVKMDVSTGAADHVAASRLEMETRLVDANTLSFKATMNGLGEGAESGVMTFVVKRDESGACQIAEQSNTFQ